MFALLAAEIIPELIAAQIDGQPVRIWIAGCSTGEETYSLVMLFHEFMDKTHHTVKLQFFASDVDADAVASAREGLYPDTIAADVSPQRLARFFSKEGRGYRVLPDLRASVVFTVQDVLADPPFSRLDLVSCRNLLIYLLPEAQARVFSLFHFALRKDGVLLLGNTENVPDNDQYFEAISKPAHLFRHVGRHRAGEHRFSVNPREATWGPARNATVPSVSRQSLLADLVRKLVIEAHSPAAVLINRKFECLYLLGPTERFLHVAPGHPTFDVLAMALPAIRARLRTTIQRAMQGSIRVIAPGGDIERDGHPVPFSIDIQPVSSDGRDLLLVCFIEAARSEPARSRAVHDASPDVALEHELEATRAELEAAIHDLQISAEDQKSINDEASSLNEELQSTNEELLTSKEELQSLNEELTALNTQLHEALERQRTTSNDLQNVLNSTNVATVFLDTELKIRFFTPSTRSVFNVIPGDIGRPLADLTSLSADAALLSDARAVLQSLVPVEREIEAIGGQWYVRRILPYRTEDLGVEGVVITFVDSTERRRAADALVAAKREAELSSVAKSRFLAAASHDLRQPLQSLSLLSGVLAQFTQLNPETQLQVRVGNSAELLDLMQSGQMDVLLCMGAQSHGLPF